MSRYLRNAAIVLLHLGAVLALVSVNVEANGRSDANPWGVVALALVAIGMLKASELTRED